MALENNSSDSWLRADLFENILNEIVPNYKKITQFKSARALKPGENYATIMLRIEIVVELQDGKNKSISFMIKTPVDNVEFMDKFSTVFEIEAEMYLDIVPDFENMYKKAGKDVKFCAKSFTLETNNLNILLEDLRSSGFRNIDRKKGIDLKHAEWVLRKMAQWHAASAVRVQLKGPYKKTLSSGYFHEENKEFLEKMFTDSSTTLLPCLEKVSKSETFMSQVREFHPHCVTKVIEILKNDENEFLVLNHGDLWANNIMFQYHDNGDIKEVFLVDYQVPIYCSPIFDLLYFILSSTAYEVKIKYFDYFISFYHKNLVENLKLLGYSKKIPTLKEIQIDCIKRGAWAYSCAVNITPVVLADTDDNANLENFMGNSEEGIAFKTAMYTTDRYQKQVQMMLPWLISRGALEL